MSSPIRPRINWPTAVVAVAAFAVAAVALARVDDPQLTQGGAVSGETVSVELDEFSIDPSPIRVPPGSRLDVHNAGALPHNLAVEGTDLVTPDLNSGETASLDLTGLDAGDYTLVCLVAGHKEAGMRTPLTIAEGAIPPAAAGDHGAATDWAALDQAMMDSILAFPAETEGRGVQPLEPTVVDGVKVFELTTEIVDWEVEPGKVVQAWAYNGQVPGPEIRLDVGDRVRVLVRNRLPMGTDVHWHGIKTPKDQDGVAPLTQELIRAGEDFVYEFDATEPAVGMYHAHHHGQMQVPNGLFGPLHIGDLPLPAGRTIGGRTLPQTIDVAREIPMVLNDAGVIGFSLNGKSFPATEPYAVNNGDWLLVHYYNEGLQSHPMHLHQFPQLVVAKDGIPLDQPYWGDTINVAPGERYSVLVNPDLEGTWVWHCHILNHVERDTGMFGMVTALVVS